METTAHLKPFSVSAAVRVCVTYNCALYLGKLTDCQACHGVPGTGTLKDTPLQVLVPTNKEPSFMRVPYIDQPYVAISYCWPGGAAFKRLASSNSPTIVTIDDAHVHSVHFSRFIADTVQSHNQSTGRALAVWIDFHCINQTDNTEKAEQVAIMQGIYARAETTLIMLEDLSITQDDRNLLLRFKHTEGYVPLVRRIISSRWFTRAWCSQELVLSSRAYFHMHDALNPGSAIRIDSGSLWHCMDIARSIDGSIPLFSQPRGRVLVGLFNAAWALNIVQHLGCSDEYDKISLVCNLQRYNYIFTARPNAFGAPADVAPTVRLNVLKMANIMAIGCHDYSLLLANHGQDNPFHGLNGFGWAGVPVREDRLSDVWVEKDYEISRDPHIAIHGAGLLARGVVASIVQEHVWDVRREVGGITVTVDGTARSIALDHQTHVSWSWTRASQLFRVLLSAICNSTEERSPISTRDPQPAFVSNASEHARIVLGHLLADPDYHDQPPPILGDTFALLHELLATHIGDLRDIAKAVSFLWQDSDARATFSTVHLSEGSVLLLSGNAPLGALTGLLLFQPFVVRPKLFSPPVVLTANSLVLESVESEPQPDNTRRCVGAVRGLGMIREDPASFRGSGAHEQQFRII